MEFGNDRKNSRIAKLAIALFVAFDLAALGMNFWLSNHIEHQAISINLAGRQRMLSQRMVKVLLQMDNMQRRGGDVSVPLTELRLTFDLFDTTLQGFDAGGDTHGGAGEDLFLEPAEGEGARAAVNRAVALWAPYRTRVLAVLEAGPRVHPSVLSAAIDTAESKNLPLLEAMNQLTTELELQTKSDAARIRIYQGTAFLLAILNFFWAFFVYIRRLRNFSKGHTLLDEMIHKISASVLVLGPDNRVLKANLTAEHMFGFERGELAGRSIDELLIARGTDFSGIRKDGSDFTASVQNSPATFADQMLHVVTVLDITSQRMTEEHLSALAYHDLLTRLPNRLLFNDRLKMEIAHAQRRGLILAVMFLDLDHFKPVNDEHGHEVGDLLLQDVAVRLSRCLRETDTVSRRGGDEFTIIITDIGELENIERMAQLVLSQILRPFHVENLELRVACSIGISLFPQDGAEPLLLIRRADEAMYQAKNAGGSTYRFFSAPESVWERSADNSTEGL